MVRYLLFVLLIAACAGCGSQTSAGTEATTPILDPDKANAEVAGYLKLAREYLSRKEFDKAVGVLERAVSVDGATNTKEATELLTATLPLHTHSPQPTNTARYSSSMGPVEVVQGYLGSGTWRDRVPFVLRPIETGPLMANVYQDGRFNPSMFRPGKILPLKHERVPVGSRLTVTVDMSESSPEKPYWEYVLEHTDAGYKIDWEASRALDVARTEAATRRALQLDNPVLEVKVLKVEQQSSYVYVHLRVTNRSNKYLQNWQIAIELSDSAGAYLAKETATGFNLAAGASNVEKVMVHNLSLKRIADWNFKPEMVRITLAADKTADATKYFTVKSDQ